MGDIGPVRRRFEVLSGADLEGPSLERLASVAGRPPRRPAAAEDATRRTSTASPPAVTGERDDAPAD